MFCKGLISKIYKEFIHLNSKQKKKQLNFKKGKGLNRHFFFKRRNTDGKQAQRMMLYICNLQRNANPHQQKLPPHIYQNSNHQKNTNKCWQGCGEK